MKYARWFWLVVLLFLAGSACAEEARDITADCTFSTDGSMPYRAQGLYDRSYRSVWKTREAKNPYLEITLPEGERCSGVEIKWQDVPETWHIEVLQGDEWVSIYQDESGYHCGFAALPDVTRFRIAAHRTKPQALEIFEITVLSQGERPDWVQVWQPTPEKADLLLLVAHPDDEYIFMGGVIPEYSAQQQKDVVVAYLTASPLKRRLELLDGLWTAGHRSYPVIAHFPDCVATNLNEAYELIGRKSAQRWMTSLVRRYRPDVVVTHDVEGEYGHGAHKVCADLLLRALKESGDPSEYPESAEAYGTWDIPKAYIHLYPENQITLDWQRPLSAFDGRTALSVAADAFACHISQQETKYEVVPGGEYDNALFGLVRSLVGPDIEGGDFFENLP